MHNLFFLLEFCNAVDRISPALSVIYSLNMLAPAQVLLKQTCRVRSVCLLQRVEEDIVKMGHFLLNREMCGPFLVFF